METPGTENAPLTGTRAVDPMTYVRVLIRRKWIILGVLVATLASVALYTLRQPRIYKATASLIIDLNAPRFLENSQVQEVVETGTGSYWFSKEYFETQYKVLVSRAVSQRVVDKLGLQNDLAFLALDRVQDKTLQERLLQSADAVALLQSKIRIQPVKDSRIVYVSIEDVDPKRAALLANEIGEAFVAENLALKVRLTESASTWLEDRLAGIQEQTRASEVAVFNFKKAADMLTTSLEDRQSMISQRLNAVNLSLTETRMKIAGLKARVQTIEHLKQTATNDQLHWAEGIPTPESDELVKNLRLQYATQTSECAELSQRYLSDHPKLVACQDRLRAIEHEIARELGNIVRSANAELTEAL